MFLTAVSFCASAYLEHCIQRQPQERSVSVAWQIPQITLLTVAEILLNVTGLEFAYSQAPPAMQTLILALYLFTTTLGDALGALLYSTVFASMDGVLSIVLCALCMLANLACFARVASTWAPYKRASLVTAEGGGGGNGAVGTTELSIRRRGATEDRDEHIIT